MKTGKYLIAFVLGTIVVLGIYSTVFRSPVPGNAGDTAGDQRVAAATSSVSAVAPGGGAVSIEANDTKAISPPRSGSGEGGLLSQPTAASNSSDASLSWRAVSRSGDLTAGILGLLASANPDDWMRASALNVLCATAVPTDAERSGGAKGELSTQHKKLLEQVRQRCGDAAASIVPLVQSGMVTKAKEAGSKLANARLTTALLKEGLSNDEIGAVRNIVSDPDLAGAWFTLNRSGLLKAMSGSEAFAGTSPSEQYAAYSIALCSLGEDCSSQSLHALSVCIQSLLAACNGTSVQDGVLSTVAPERRSKANEYAELLLASLRAGDVATVGMKIKANQ
jgi:hypothetical protein